MFELYHGDCLEIMPQIPAGSVDLILTDPPYGTTACKWDTVIPFEAMWEQVWRLLKANCACAIFGSEPFMTLLRQSALDKYKYDWYWDKKFGGNFAQAKRMPLKTVEPIAVFSQEKTLPKYFPKMVCRDIPIKQGGTKTADAIPIKNNPKTHNKKIYDKKYPITNLHFPKNLGKTKHPTEKPVPVLEYLIETYTIEGETVLDFTMGAGSTGVACINTGRTFIGIEKDEKYFKIAEKRIQETNDI